MCQSKWFLQLLWPAQMCKTEKENRIVDLLYNQQFLWKETEGKCYNKERTGVEKVWMTSVQRLQLHSEDVVQKNPFEGREDSPCLYCNKLFSFSQPGESWFQYTECKLWAHCVLEVQKEGKCFSDICNWRREARGVIPCALCHDM